MCENSLIVKAKYLFSRKINVVFAIFVFFFTLYYISVIQNIFSCVRLSYNDTKNSVYVDVSEGKNFNVAITEKYVSELHFPYISYNEEIDEFYVSIIGKDLSFTYRIEKNDVGKESFLIVEFVSPHEELNGQTFEFFIHADDVKLKLDESGYAVYKQRGRSPVQNFVILGLVIFVAIALFVIFKTRKFGIEERFLIIGFIFGLFYMFAHPPCSLYDDWIHYDTAYNMSNIMLGYGDALVTGKFQKRKCDIDLLPKDYQNDYYLNNSWRYENHYRAYYVHFLKNIFKHGDSEMVDFPLAEPLKPQRAFVFSAVAISVSRLLGLNQFFNYYSGAFINLVLSLLLVYFGLKKNSYIKNNVILIIALFPVSLLLFGSYSYDAMLISFSFATINYAINIFYQEKKSIKDIMVIIFLSLFLFPIKIVYFPIALYLPMLYFSVKIKHKKLIFFFILLCTYILLYVLSLLTKSPFIQSRAKYLWEPNFYCYSIADIIQHPFNSFRLIFNVIMKKLLKESFIENIFYFNFDHIENPRQHLGVHPHLFDDMVLILFMLLFFMKNNIKIITLPSFLVAIITAMFVIIVGIHWSKFGGYDVWGIQARYFLPILPLLFYSVERFSPVRFKVKISYIFEYICLINLFYLINMFLGVIF